MLGLKVDKIFEQSENMKNNIEKINTTNIIKDAINLSLNKGNIKKLNDDKEETLNILYDKTIKNYLNYLKKCSLDEAEQKFKNELIENKKHIKSILIKSENEINEYKKKFLNASEENKNLTNKIYTLQNYNRELLKQNQTYLNNFEKLDHIGKGNVINVSENKYKNYSIGEEDINKIRNSLSLDAIKKGLPTKIKIFKCVIWKNIKPDSNEKTLESFIRRNGTHLFERGGYVVNLPSKHNSISNEISTSNVKSFDEK